MPQSVAIIGAGVSGLTCGVVFAERGYRTEIFAEEIVLRTTSAAAGALWYPYDTGPVDAVTAWALQSYQIFLELSQKPDTGVSMIELRTFSRTGEIQIPTWAVPLGARRLDSSALATGLRPVPSGAQPLTTPPTFRSGFAMTVPLMDTTIYLDYLVKRFREAGGLLDGNVHLEKLEEIGSGFELVINCSGIGAKRLVPDPDLEPHRGQVAIVAKLDMSCAIVCDDPPLMYAIPRAQDCVFGGTNEVSDNPDGDPAETERIVAECGRVLNIEVPKILTTRVGLRPFRKSGVCLRADRLRDGRPVLHNYGHGGAGFTLSWGCAQRVFDLAGAL